MGEMRERVLRGALHIADDAENAAEFGQVQALLARWSRGAWDERRAQGSGRRGTYSGWRRM
jgi:hypothetical protein